MVLNYIKDTASFCTFSNPLRKHVLHLYVCHMPHTAAEPGLQSLEPIACKTYMDVYSQCMSWFCSADSQARISAVASMVVI